jgi:hypothetical protein
MSPPRAPALAGYRPTLAVHVVWHPRCKVAGSYAQALFAHLFEDPDDLASHGLRIPVRLWRSASGEREPPPPAVPPLAEAERNAVVVLIDDEFLAAEGWTGFLDDVAAAAGARDIVLGVSLSATGLRLRSRVASRNFIRLHTYAANIRRTVLLNRVTHALCRLTASTEEPVRVFLSHAKLDGLKITAQVRDFLHDGSGVADFFDAQDLLEGVAWGAMIRGAASENVLLAVRTDAYATREWCRTEILEAKLGGSPVVVLDALETLEPRGFPYLGNTPSVRWRRNSPAAMEHLLGVVLRETLRFRHFPTRVADLCRAYGLPPHDRVLASPPELLTVLRAREPSTGPPLVYPDPPLGTEELALVRELAPDLALTTPTGLLARG